MINGKVIELANKKFVFELSMWDGDREVQRPHRSKGEFKSKAEASRLMVGAIKMAEHAVRTFE